MNKGFIIWIQILMVLSTIPVVPILSSGSTDLIEIGHESYIESEDDPENKNQTMENRIAIIDTTYGVIKFELFERRAPITTANFIKLSKEFFYDGILFHRVIDDFVIQTGDPNTKDNNPYNDGSGGSSDTIKLEIHPELTHVDGAVGMARSTDPDSASSQFYICDGPQHGLDGDYAVFGLVFEGIDVVRKIASVETWGNKRPVLKDHPINDVVMYTVFITQNESEFKYTPPDEDSSFWSTWSTPGFEGAFLIAAIFVTFLIYGKRRRKIKV